MLEGSFKVDPADVMDDNNTLDLVHYSQLAALSACISPR